MTIRNTLLTIAFAFVMFTRLDGHKVWINTDAITMVQGAGQLNYPTGTLITTSNGHVVVNQNVSEVIRTLRGTP